MQTHHLLATLRILKPSQESEFRKILQDHDILYCKEQFDSAWQFCLQHNYNQVVSILNQSKQRSKSLHKPQLHRKLAPLVKIFDQLDAIRQDNGIQPVLRESEMNEYDLEQLRHTRYDGEMNEMNQEVLRLRYLAERQLKSFIYEASFDRGLMESLQEGILKFQEERIKQNERLGKVGAEKALQRLRESENLRELKLLKDVNFIMQNDDNFARAYQRCLQEQSQKQKIQRIPIQLHNEQQIIMNSYINTMSFLHQQQEIDVALEEDNWCYGKKKNNSKQKQIMENSQIQACENQLGDLQQVQIVESAYNLEKDSIMKNSKFKNVKLQRIPIVVNYQVKQHKLKMNGDLILFVTYESYKVKECQEKTIIQCIIPNEMMDENSENMYFGGFHQRINPKVDVDHIILIPFSENIKLIDRSTKSLRIEYKQLLFNLLCSFINRLDKVCLILCPTIPFHSIVEIIDLVVNIKLLTRSKQYYQELVMNCYKIMEGQQFIHYLIQFDVNENHINFLKEKLGIDFEQIPIEILIAQIFRTKQLNISYLIKNSSKTDQVHRITSQCISYGTDQVIADSNFSNKLVSELLLESNEDKRDSYFNI